MTERTNADLIAARDTLEQHDLGDVCDESTHGAITIVLDALEAADHRAAQAEAELKDAYRTDIPSLKDQRDAAIKRAEEAERERAKVEAHTVMLLRNGRQVLDQRNQLADVIEKVREWADRNNETGYGTGTGASALEILDILAAAPADVLREHDAALIEKLADEWHADNTGTSPRAYSWLRDKARQRREERA